MANFTIFLPFTCVISPSDIAWRYFQSFIIIWFIYTYCKYLNYRFFLKNPDIPNERNNEKFTIKTENEPMQHLLHQKNDDHYVNAAKIQICYLKQKGTLTSMVWAQLLKAPTTKNTVSKQTMYRTGANYGKRILIPCAINRYHATLPVTVTPLKDSIWFTVHWSLFTQ